MVLQSFSWQDFGFAAVALLVLWYVGLAVLFRKGKPDAGAGDRAEPLTHGWQDRVDVLSESEELMGKSVLDHGMSVVEAEDFSFVETESFPDQLDQLGLIADVQQEIKSICTLLAEQDGSKEHFFSLFQLVRDKYPGLADIPQLSALNEFIREQVPFHLSEQELEDLWF